jgi:hypothetical protein
MITVLSDYSMLVKIKSWAGSTAKGIIAAAKAFAVV